uniref:Putative secreted protein n=1 Tax=Ixodes ricinus TaxID=34613 RepID=A0A6B0U1Y1_IXORI
MPRLWLATRPTMPLLSPLWLTPQLSPPTRPTTLPQPSPLTPTLFRSTGMALDPSAMVLATTATDMVLEATA